MDNYEQLCAQAIEQLFKGGAFLMTGKQEKNPMTIGWCQFGRLWNEKVCTVFVRPSRHSFSLLERDDVFSISFPSGANMKKELGFCGTKSGRDVNKLEALNISTIKGRTGGVDVLGGCAVHFECKVLDKIDMGLNMDALDEKARKMFYNPDEQAGDNGDWHMIYFAKVLEAYTTE